MNHHLLRVAFGARHHVLCETRWNHYRSLHDGIAQQTTYQYPPSLKRSLPDGEAVFSHSLKTGRVVPLSVFCIILDCQCEGMQYQGLHY